MISQHGVGRTTRNFITLRLILYSVTAMLKLFFVKAATSERWWLVRTLHSDSDILFISSCIAGLFTFEHFMLYLKYMLVFGKTNEL